MPDAQWHLLPTEWTLRFPVVTLIIERIERTYDGIPRAGGARVEAVGPFELFLPAEPGAYPLYARPRLGATEVSVDDVLAVRDRQRELGVPEAFEWVQDITPATLAAVRESGMPVALAPLMVLDPEYLPDPDSLLDASLVELLVLDADAAEYAGLFNASSAVANLGFSAMGTGVGAAGPSERDAALAPMPTVRLERSMQGSRTGRTAEAVARTRDEGVLARGAYQGALGAAEVVGVATLPSARRRGLGAAVTALLARHALDHGYDMVFLGAADEAVAHIYGRIGFGRVGTACIAELDSC
jgi:ribosomal protein S18 acetylase RimI-like enzyme